MRQRRTQKDFSRQMYAVCGFEVCRDGYEVVEFTTEEWAGNHVFVKRTRRPLHVTNCAYHEAFVVGPRGAVKELYSSYY